MRLKIVLTNRQRQFILLLVLSFVAILFGLMAAQWFVIAIPVLAIVAGLLVGRRVTTRKISLRFLKSVRPLILLLGVIMFISNGSGSLKANALIILIPIAVVLTLLFGTLIRYELAAEPAERVEHTLALINVFLISNAIALFLAVWHMPLALALALSWFLNYMMVNFWLYNFVDKPERLSLLWSLLTLELTFMSSFWLIFYAIPLINVAVSQLALIITSFAYCMGGIYFHHKKHTLTRGLMFEYFGVAAVVFSVLLILTKWFHGV